MMWILIMSALNLGSGHSMAAVHGFLSKQACESAGKQWSEKQFIRTNYLCVPVELVE